jgi:polyisoprenoid-binding protein YceI
MQKFEFDTTHSTVGFMVRHLMVSKVRGAFTRWGGTLAFDESAPEKAELDVSIDAASIDTHEKQRDDHLRSADFFDAANHPALTFRAKGAKPAGEGRYTVQGELTIRGTTRPVTLEVEYNGRAKDPWGGERVAFEARTSINRKDFGLTWNQALETGGVLVGEKIEISLDVQAKAVAAAAAA